MPSLYDYRRYVKQDLPLVKQNAPLCRAWRILPRKADRNDKFCDKPSLSYLDTMHSVRQLREEGDLFDSIQSQRDSTSESHV